MTEAFKPLDGGQFLPLGRLLRTSLLRRLDPEIVQAELLAQIAAFKQMFGRAKKILASELMYARDMGEDEASEFLENLLDEIARGRIGKPAPVDEVLVD